MKVGKTLYVKNRMEWRRWLANHHKSGNEIWLIYYKKASGKPRIPRPSAFASGGSPPEGTGPRSSSSG